VAELSIQRLRERLPVIVFILLFVLLLMVVGIACACATDHPAQALERVLSAIDAAPAVVILWPYVFAAVAFGALIFPRRYRAMGRASPQVLQRFLF